MDEVKQETAQAEEPVIEEPKVEKKPELRTFNREFTINRSDETKNGSEFDISFSSTVPYSRYYWGLDTDADEILLHGADNVDLSRLNCKGSVLFNHNRDEFVGVINSAYLKDNKGRVAIRFSDVGKGAEIAQAVRSGILNNVSVGYTVDDYKYVPATEKENAKMLITKWTPYEVSVVTAPADISVGFGRTIQEEKPLEVSMGNEKDKKQESTETIEPMTREQEVKEIQALAKHYELKEDMVKDYIEAGVSLDNFRKEVVIDHLREKYKQPANIATEDLTDKEREAYDISRAIMAVFKEKSSGGAKTFRELAPFEYEVNQDLRSRREKSGTRVRGDIVLPNNLIKGKDVSKNVQARSMFSSSRTMLTTTNTAITPVDYMESNLVDILLTPIREHGFTTMTDLTGQVVIPRFLSGTTGNWIAENSTTTATDVAFDTVSMQLHTAQAKNQMSIQSEMVTPFPIRQMVTDNLVYSLQYLLYNTIFNGTGTAPAPKGLLNYSGMGAIASSGSKVINANFATSKKEIVYSDLVGAETLVKLQKILTPNLKFIGNPKMTGQLKTTLDDSNTQSVRLLRDGMLDGYEYQESFVVPDNTLIYGDFSKMCIGIWGTPEIFVDPIDDNGLIKTKVFMFADLMNLLPQAFAIITNSASA